MNSTTLACANPSSSSFRLLAMPVTVSFNLLNNGWKSSPAAACSHSSESAFVTPFGAESTTAAPSVWWVAVLISITRMYRGASAREEPPNFKTFICCSLRLRMLKRV